MQLSGLLLAYWEAQSSADGEPDREMSLRFYPDAQSREALPRFASDNDDPEPADRIFLYRERTAGSPFDRFETIYSAGETDAIEEALTGFETVPDGFLEYQEGYAIQPATVTLDGLTSFVEGNDRFLYAHASKVEPVTTSDYLIEQIPDSDPDRYLGRPWLETFQVDEAAELRAEPSDSARTIAQIEAGTIGIEKIATAPDGWTEVLVRGEDGNETARGFIRTAQLMSIN